MRGHDLLQNSLYSGHKLDLLCYILAAFSLSIWLLLSFNLEANSVSALENIKKLDFSSLINIRYPSVQCEKESKVCFELYSYWVENIDKEAAGLWCIKY